MEKKKVPTTLLKLERFGLPLTKKIDGKRYRRKISWIFRTQEEAEKVATKRREKKYSARVLERKYVHYQSLWWVFVRKSRR